jgi:hypothetical protein
MKLDMMIPQWLLEEERWVEFLEALESVVSDIESNIGDLKKLYDAYECGEFLEKVADQFSFGLIYRTTDEVNRLLLDIAKGFIRHKGSLEFFQRLFELLGYTYALRDLSKDVLMPSYQGILSGSYLENASYYRDGSVEVTVPVSMWYLVQELSRFVSAGVYVWYSVITGVRYFLEETQATRCYTDSKATRHYIEDRVSYNILLDVPYTSEIDTQARAKHTGYYFVMNECSVILS